MKLSTFPFKFQNNFEFIFKILSNFENNLIKKKEINTLDPVFICGCPRSGTTILAEILNNSGYFASYLYKDMPYFKIPIIWNFLRNKLIKSDMRKIQRVHGDEIYYNYNSPDAFEELIWSKNLPSYDKNLSKFLDFNYENTNLIFELEKNMKKIIFIRDKKRYLSKGNYNLYRINFLKKNFKKAKFIIVIRDPIQTCYSLENIHNKFKKEAKNNLIFDEVLDCLCHFEFGNRRKIIDICNNKNTILNLWSKGYDFLGYLYQWNEIYNFVYDNYLIDDFKENIFIFNYESFKSNHVDMIKKLYSFLDIKINVDKLNFNALKFKKNLELKKNIKDDLIKTSFDLFEKINEKF